MYESYIISSKNFRLIMSVLFEHFLKKYNYEVGPDEEELTNSVLRRVLTNDPAKKNEPAKTYVKKINQKCISTVVQIISNKLKPQQKIVNPETELTQHNPLISNNDVTNKFEELNNLRIQNSDKEKEKMNKLPQFGEQIVENNKDIINKFEQLNQLRTEEQEKVIEVKLAGDSFETSQLQQSDIISANVNDVMNLKNPPKSAGQHLLIEKPKEFKELVDNAYKYNNNYVKSKHLVIDSRDRNTDDYPNNYNYQVDLDYIYKDVLSVELVSANVPKSQYLINSSNNKIYFTDNGSSELIATIPTGNYTSTTLGVAIGAAMTTAGTNTFTVTDNTLTNTYTIEVNTGTYELKFDGGSETYGTSTRTKHRDDSMAPLIGFTAADLTGVITYTAPNQYNFNGPTYILLHIDNFDNLEGVNNSAVTKSFAKIILDTDLNSYKYFKSQSDYITKKEFSPPLAKLAQLNIQFRNYDNSFYDFSGLEHCLYFKVTTLNQASGYFH